MCDLAIEILVGPQDVTVSVGQTAHFSCLYAGTTVVPFWVIDNKVFPIDRLPERHSYSNVLTVSNVLASDSGRTYRCSFKDPESRTATLTVSSQGSIAVIIHINHLLCLTDGVKYQSLDKHGKNRI